MHHILLADGPAQGVDQKFHVLQTDPNEFAKQPCLMLAALVVWVERVVRYLPRIDNRTICVWDLHRKLQIRGM